MTVGPAFRLAATAAIEREAGQLARALFVQGVSAEFKSPLEYVPEADGRVEALIRAHLAEVLPDDSTLGEEGSGTLGAERTWIIDPTDGTANFAHDAPQFAVSIGLVEGGRANLGARLRAQTRVEIKALHQRMGTTTVYVTHDQAEAMTMADRIVVMDQGGIEQVGRPLALYDRPANRFVAGFLGSPAMNFFTGDVTGGAEADGAAPALALGEHRLTLPAAARGMSRIVADARPEHVHLAPDGVPAEVVVVEPMGSETHVTARTADQVFTLTSRARVDAHPGERLCFAVDAADIHLFDVASGARIA